MDNSLTYPSLRCILEFLEANKRLHIASRSPTLQRFEKSVPLHVNYLHTGVDFLSINNHEYDIVSEDEEVTDTHIETRPAKEGLSPGDLRVGPDTTSFLEMHFKNDHDAFQRRRLLKGIEEHVAAKKMMCYFLEGRPDIYVAHLEISVHGKGILRLPENLKFRTKMLTTRFDDFRGLLSLLHASSFPLKKLDTLVEKEDAMKHCVLKSSESLTINSGGDEHPWNMPSFEELTNRHIILQLGPVIGNNEGIIRIIQRYKEKILEIGSSLTITWIPVYVFWLCLKSIESRFDGTTVNVASEGTRGYYAITINSTTSTLLVEASYCNDFLDYLNLKLKVVPLSAIEPIPSVAPVDDEKSVSSPNESSKWTVVALGMVGSCVIVIFALFHDLILRCW